MTTLSYNCTLLEDLFRVSKYVLDEASNKISWGALTLPFRFPKASLRSKGADDMERLTLASCFWHIPVLQWGLEMVPRLCLAWEFADERH